MMDMNQARDFAVRILELMSLAVRQQQGRMLGAVQAPVGLRGGEGGKPIG